MTRVSIALCTFNGERFLGDQLDSFLVQSRLPNELLVCDDGSSDRTLEVLKDFARRSPFPLKIHRNEANMGFARNFEKAISLCSGDLIFPADQDDVWLPEKIEIMTQRFDSDPELRLVFTNADLVDEDLEPIGTDLYGVAYNANFRESIAAGTLLDLLLKQNHLAGATLAFRRDLLEYLVPFPHNIPKMFHDGWIGLIGVASGGYEFIDLPLIRYRQHDRQLIGVDDAKFEMMGREPDAPKRIAAAAALARAHVERISAIVNHIRTSTNLANLTPAIKKAAIPLMAKLNQEIDHLTARNALSSSLIKRGRFVVQETFSGNYHRFSNGFKSVLRDMFFYE